MKIKNDPELRHVLAHMLMAIEHASKGEVALAHYELEQIESMIFFETDAEMGAHFDAMQQTTEAEKG